MGVCAAVTGSAPSLRVVEPGSSPPATAAIGERLAPQLHIYEDDESVGAEFDTGDANGLQTEQTRNSVLMQMGAPPFAGDSW
jgi:hypothetical protein